MEKDINLLIEHDTCVISPVNYETSWLDSGMFSEFSDILSICFGVKNFLLDLRDAKSIYYDLLDGLGTADSIISWNFIVSSTEMADEIKFKFKETRLLKNIAVDEDKTIFLKTKPYIFGDGFRTINNDALDIIFEELFYLDEPMKLEAINDWGLGLLYKYKDYMLDNYSQNSLLGTFGIFFDELKNFNVRPFHCHSNYELSLDTEILITRPSILAHRTKTFLMNEILQFEEILNRQNVKELEIENFLIDHPHFLRGVNQNIMSVYPQVLLQREKEKSLKPDFILEPVGEKWCDILDIKLPTANLVVGTPNRRRLSSAIMEGIAQLQEYQRYFEDSRNRGSFRELMRSKGALDVDCYFPKLSLVIGRDPTELDEDQIRRQLMTKYADIKIMTYDQILMHAKNNLLI